jgi:hypothetical protein
MISPHSSRQLLPGNISPVHFRCAATQLELSAIHDGSSIVDRKMSAGVRLKFCEQKVRIVLAAPSSIEKVRVNFSLEPLLSDSPPRENFSQIPRTLG